MKSILLTVLVTVVSYNLAFTQSRLPVDNPEQWIEQHFAKGKTPPFSFVYGGKKSDSFICNWQYQFKKTGKNGDNEDQYLITYTDNSTGLSVKCTATGFTDFPAVEWVLHFVNTSGKNTPLIEKVTVIDQTFITGGEGPAILHHARGSDAERTDFGPIDEPVEIGKSISIAQPMGRSSSHTAFPFFNIAMSKTDGMVVAIGWTGRWYADISQAKEKQIALKSGLQKIQTTLYPKEEIRTPRICLLFWEGEDRMAGHNSFRQFVLQHHSRKINGKFAEYPLSAGFSFGDPSPSSEYECLTEKYALALVDRYRQFGIVPEVFWLDAGWYKGCECGNTKATWWENAGSWTADKDRFPDGLRPVADAIHAIGSKFMVWFEPERVSPGSLIHREHPEWLIKPDSHTSYLFNLGDEKARLWMTDHISNLIRKEGIDYYRQDFNIDPHTYWDVADKPGRIGITEIKHVEGLYAYWDSLLVRFPNLLIDNCAGGGRRIDLEMISRGAPLWRTDYQYGEPVGKQCHTYSLNFYIPLHGTGISTEDDFTFRSGLGSAAQGAWILGRGKETIEVNRKYMQDFKELRPYFYGDYYPLTSTVNYTWDNVWLAYQLNRPKEKDGVIIAFRRKENNLESIRVKLAGLDKNTDYELYYEDYGVKNIYKGSELMQGFDITIRTRPASLLIRYKAVK